MTDRIAEITARCEQATPGPWEANWLDDCFIEPRICMIPANGCYDYDKFEANSEFIAHAREDIPYLLSQLAERNQETRSAELSKRKYQEIIADLEDEIKSTVALRDSMYAEKDAEEQGLLVVLPCKVGDTVYADIDGTGSGFYDACIISEIKIMKDHAEPLFTALCYEKGDYQTYWASDFGKEVFLAPSDAKKKQKRPLTRAEAEAALKGADHEI